MTDPELLIHQYREAAKRYAAAKAQADYLDHYRHVVLATQMMAAEVRGAKSVAAQDRDARTSDEYLLHLKAQHAAISEEVIRKADLRAAEHAIEVWRTQQANERLERKAYAA